MFCLFDYCSFGIFDCYIFDFCNFFWSLMVGGDYFFFWIWIYFDVYCSLMLVVCVVFFFDLCIYFVGCYNLLLSFLWNFIIKLYFLLSLDCCFKFYCKFCKRFCGKLCIEFLRMKWFGVLNWRKGRFYSLGSGDWCDGFGDVMIWCCVVWWVGVRWRWEGLISVGFVWCGIWVELFR